MECLSFHVWNYLQCWGFCAIFDCLWSLFEYFKGLFNNRPTCLGYNFCLILGFGNRDLKSWVCTFVVLARSGMLVCWCGSPYSPVPGPPSLSNAWSSLILYWDRKINTRATFTGSCLKTGPCEHPPSCTLVVVGNLFFSRLSSYHLDPPPDVFVGYIFKSHQSESYSYLGGKIRGIHFACAKWFGVGLLCTSPGDPSLITEAWLLLIDSLVWLMSWLSWFASIGSVSLYKEVILYPALVVCWHFCLALSRSLTI